MIWEVRAQGFCRRPKSNDTCHCVQCMCVHLIVGGVHVLSVCVGSSPIVVKCSSSPHSQLMNSRLYLMAVLEAILAAYRALELQVQAFGGIIHNDGRRYHEQPQ